MPYHTEDILFIGASLILLSIFLEKFVSKVGIPTLLIFLGIGLMFGNGGKFDFYYDSPQLTMAIAEVSLCFILFFGGLGTKIDYIKPVVKEGITLSTVGVGLTTLIFAYIIQYLGFFDWATAILLGAVISSTDAAAVFSILQSKGYRLKENISPTLELESGTNDPMAYFLTATFTSLLLSGKDFDFLRFAWQLIANMIVGGLIGWFMGYMMYRLIYILKLKQGLNPILLISLTLLTYSAAILLKGNGFLAVYIAGIVLGNKRIPHKEHINGFFEVISWLLEVSLFLILGLQIKLYELPIVFWEGLIFSAILIFIARPISVFISLIFYKTSLKKMLFISWVGLRGATPIVFALYPTLNGLQDGEFILHLTFFIVLTSILIQGSSIPLITKWLNLDDSIK
ncbi:MAG: potassium/proton antiporter [Flammeovirgaceae bacterium]